MAGTATDSLAGGSGKSSVPAGRSLLGLLRRINYFGLSIALLLLLLAQAYVHFGTYHLLAEEMRETHILQQQETIQREVQRIVERVRYSRSALDQVAAERARQRVRLGVDLIDNILQAHPEATAESLKPIIFDALRAIRFDQGRGYFFLLDLSGLILLHPIYPEREGRNQLSIRDGSGNSFVAQIIARVKASGEGALSYGYDKPGEEGAEFPKLSYVKRIERLNWIIGTGIYLDDLEREEKQRLLAEIQDMRYGDNGYFFVDDWDGVVLAHGTQPDLVGQNIIDHTDHNGVKVVQLLIEAAKKTSGDFVRYSWLKPDTLQERPKVSFSMGIPAWRWMIGTGIYTDDVEKTIQRLHDTLVSKMLFSMLGVLTGVLLVGLLIHYWIRRVYHSLQRDVGRFRTFFSEARPGARLDDATMGYSEHRELVGHLNRMMEARDAASRDLLEQQGKLEETVRQRTESLQIKSEELRLLATTDTLTGLSNRYHFSQLLQQYLKEAHRYQVPGCLVMIDVDHFKAVNDHFGHDVGDEVLRGVAQHLRTQLREVDHLARWGGEEFTLLLGHTSLTAGVELCQRLCDLLGAEPDPVAGVVTASFGITAILPEDSLNTVVKRADEALYKAKAAGRNRVEVS